MEGPGATYRAHEAPSHLPHEGCFGGCTKAMPPSRDAKSRVCVTRRKDDQAPALARSRSRGAPTLRRILNRMRPWLGLSILQRRPSSCEPMRAACVAPAPARITGTLFVELGGNAFPDAGWSDFPVVVLGWWVRAALALQRTGAPTSFMFMDGPFELELRRAGPS